jgi:hypothetical protein
MKNAIFSKNDRKQVAKTQPRAQRSSPTYLLSEGETPTPSVSVSLEIFSDAACSNKFSVCAWQMQSLRMHPSTIWFIKTLLSALHVVDT